MLNFPAPFAQEGRLIIAGQADKELKRTAHRLHIPISQLKNARELLQQATDLARRLDPLPVQHISSLAQFWIDVDRPHASSGLESLLKLVRRAAENAPDAASFQTISNAFQGVLQPLVELDPDKAVLEARRWPIPPQDLGDSATVLRNQLIDQFLRQLVQRLMYEDPEKAASLYGELGSSTMDYFTPGQLAVQLAGAGQKDQAYKLIDQAIAGYSSQEPSFDKLQNFIGFVQQLPGLDPDRFMQAFSLVASQAETPAPGASIGTLRLGENSVQLSAFELRMLDIFRSLSGRPELLQRALDALPGFQDKFDSIGGIDNAISPSFAGGSYSITYASGAGTIQSASTSSPVDKVSVLYKELKGKAAKDPGLVRQKLSEAVNGPDGVDLLLNLAQRSCYQDPDLGSLAVEIATPAVVRVPGLQRRSMLMQNLAATARQCDGEVDQNLLREGFVVADQLREEEAGKNPEMANRQDGNSQADYLEQALLGQVAIDHYQAALKYLNAMPDNEAKLAAQLRVIADLRSSY